MSDNSGPLDEPEPWRDIEDWTDKEIHFLSDQIANNLAAQNAMGKWIDWMRHESPGEFDFDWVNNATTQDRQEELERNTFENIYRVLRRTAPKAPLNFPRHTTPVPDEELVFLGNRGTLSDALSSDVGQQLAHLLRIDEQPSPIGEWLPTSEEGDRYPTVFHLDCRRFVFVAAVESDEDSIAELASAIRSHRAKLSALRSSLGGIDW